MAATEQPPSCSTSRFTYHVFLTFRNKDIGKTFADHLHTALLNAGIHTFRHDDDAEPGENIDSELQKAIKESKISLIVFTKNQATSRKCLDELVKIVERRRTAGHRILSVFFDVDPSDVRKQTGVVAEGLSKLEKELNDDERKEWNKKLKDWKEALSEVADLAGMVLENQADGHEAKFIKEIIEASEKKLKRTVLSVTPYPVGIKSRVNDINLWVQNGSIGIDIGVISGLGGIGKTTIAKVVYNLNFEWFEGSSFLSNIRKTSEQPNGLVRLQNQLLSDVLNGRNEKIYDPDKGIIKVQDSICCKRILLILDDVDQVEEHLNKVIGSLDWFCPGSKIIITTRREQLLRAHKVDFTYKVKELNEDESLRLFSFHAFRQDHPTSNFAEQSENVIRHVGGLPLALQVLGSSLSGRSTEVWRSELEKLEAILHNKIQNTLELSYKSLQDDHNKNLFLHIASSFVGKDKDYAIKVLEEHDFYPTVGMQDLIDRGLITIDNDNKIVMHQLLQDMARGIISKESSDEPEKYSTLLIDKTGREIIGGLISDTSSRTRLTSNIRSKRHHSEDNSNESRSLYQGNSLKRRFLEIFSWCRGRR